MLRAERDRQRLGEADRDVATESEVVDQQVLDLRTHEEVYRAVRPERVVQRVFRTEPNAVATEARTQVPGSAGEVTLRAAGNLAIGFLDLAILRVPRFLIQPEGEFPAFIRLL